MSELDGLAQAVVDWSADRPQWERSALARLARGESFSDADFVELADLAEQQARGIETSAESLTLSDLAHDGSSDEQVQLLGVHEPRSVNALLSENGLDFAVDGITLVYGENGSGKSGFARILKKVTRSRHSADVLTDVFSSPGDQSAIVRAGLGSVPQEIAWPNETPSFLRRVSFYDSDCADRYISAETEVAYRPWAISVLDALVTLSGSVRAVLESRKAERSISTISLPSLPYATRAAELVRGLSADTRSIEIDLVCELPADVDERLSSINARIQSLQTVDPAARKSQLTQVVSDIAALRTHISQTRDRLSDGVVNALQVAAAEAEAALKTAQLASSQQFASEPVAGVGSESWKSMWESARRFSLQEAFPNLNFPVVVDAGEPAHCVLCHQPLADDSSARLKSFEAFVAADTEREAGEKMRRLDELAGLVEALETEGTPIALALQRVAAEDPAAGQELKSEVDLLRERRTEILAAAPTFAAEVSPVGEAGPFLASEALTVAAQRQLDDLSRENVEEQLATLSADEAEIRARQQLRENRESIDRRVLQLQESKILDEAIRLTDTRGVTRRAADLTRTHVSDVMKHQFSQETVLLDLLRVRLADAGGGQGNLRHRAKLVGAVQQATLSSVLSEGEQTALGLAGFLTEVESDTSHSAVVLDDPVTSLDHVRRERVARRLVDLAMARQVIIFTHDVAFIVDLKRAAEAASVSVAERWISKHQQNPGRVAQGGPWCERSEKRVIGDHRKATWGRCSGRWLVTLAGASVAGDCGGDFEAVVLA